VCINVGNDGKERRLIDNKEDGYRDSADTDTSNTQIVTE